MNKQTNVPAKAEALVYSEFMRTHGATDMSDTLPVPHDSVLCPAVNERGEKVWMRVPSGVHADLMRMARCNYTGIPMPEAMPDGARKMRITADMVAV